jgi:hypothetical protein
MDRVFVRAFSQPCFLTHTFKSQLATTVIFIRGHWLKMPMHILIYHSVKKGFSQLNNLLTGKSNKKTPLPINQP